MNKRIIFIGVVILLSILFLTIYIGYNTINELEESSKPTLSGVSLISNTYEVTDEKKVSLCFTTRATPAWSQFGEIVDYGYKTTYPFNDVESLILTRTTYIYNPNCIFCQEQKKLWGEENFNMYVNSGLVLNCEEIWNDYQ